MRFIRTRLFFPLIAGVLLVAGVTSAAMAAQPQARGRACYSVCASRTFLSLSSHVVVYGRENRVRFRVLVRPRINGVGFARGTVTVKSGGNTLCTFRLTRGVGSCSPRRRALQPRRRPYSIQAVYGGSHTLGRSRSGVQFLKVII